MSRDDSSDEDGLKHREFQGLPGLLAVFENLANQNYGGVFQPLFISPELAHKHDHSLVEYLTTVQGNMQAQNEVMGRLLKEVGSLFQLRPSYSQIQTELAKALAPAPLQKVRLDKNEAVKEYLEREPLDEAGGVHAASHPHFSNAQQAQPGSPMPMKIPTPTPLLAGGSPGLQKDSRGGRSGSVDPFEQMDTHTRLPNAVYVSETYFKYLYDDMKKSQNAKYKKVLRDLEDNIQKCQKFFDFAGKEIPKIRDYSQLACTQ